MAVNTNWAQRGKAAIASAPTKQLKPVGGGSLEPISTYFQFRPLGPNAGNRAKQLTPDSEVLGVYEGSFQQKGKTKAGKPFTTTYFKVRTSEGLVAVPSATQLANRMALVPQGAEVQIIYRGYKVIEKGDRAGDSAHSFLVNASETVEG